MYVLEVQKRLNGYSEIFYRNVMNGENLNDITKEMARLILEEGVQSNRLRVISTLDVILDLKIQIKDNLERGNKNENK